ncbi:MAG: ParB N-terminal domain-containing protein [Clostridiales bacterium]|nr:ParB N-terminal domain-containing protein [Clostridiales bacterium]
MSEGGRYQILAGRNRARAAKLCGNKEIPAIIRDKISDTNAALIMLDTNLEQRHNLSYSEKAYAYKMRAELLNRRGKRTDLLHSPDELEKLFFAFLESLKRQPDVKCAKLKGGAK